MTGVWCLIPLLGVKILRLVDRTYLFKISNLVYDGREIVMNLCRRLEKTERDSLWQVQKETVYGGYRERQFMAGTERDSLWWVQRETVYGGYSELAGSPLVSVKINGSGELFGTVDIVNFDRIWDILSLAGNVAILVTLAH